LSDYIEWYNQQPFGPMPQQILDQLEDGCIGMTAVLQACDPKKGPYEDWPEDHPNNTCFLTKAEADKFNCKDKRKFVFAKQGKWKDGMPPKPDPDGSVPPGSVVGNGCDGCFNYVAVIPGGYIWMNWGNGGGSGPQVITICNVPPKDPKYPVEIWCVTCKPCKK
jgi:hypothetical protein